MKIRQRDFSIYLLKPDVDVETALDEEHELKPVGATNLPPDSALYLLEGDSDLWWPVYLGIEKELKKTRLGAILFVRASARLFAITFGHVSHQLCSESFEREFGLRVTLNSIDADKLRGTETLSPAAGRQRRTQLPIETDLTVLDFDQHTEVLKNLSGKVQEGLKSIFSSVSGTDYVRVRSDVPAHKLGDLCANLLKLLALSDYKARFPQIGKIARITDPPVVRTLDRLLVSALQARSTSLSLTVPDLTEFAGDVSAKFTGGGARGAVFHDIYIEQYFEYLDRLPDENAPSIDALRRNHKLVLTGLGKKFPLYRCLIFDTTLAGEAFHLLDGQWYRVAKEYVSQLGSELDALWSASALPDFEQATEGEFNLAVAKQLPNMACLDRGNMSPVKKHGVEPCDLLSLSGNRLRFWHVKRSTLSFMLSHLFAQGANSIHLLKREPHAVEEFRSEIKKRAPRAMHAELLDGLDAGLFDVTFAIITHKPPQARSANLPLFSKITLRRTAKELNAYGVRTRFEFVKDARERKATRSKARGKASTR